MASGERVNCSSSFWNRWSRSTIGIFVRQVMQTYFGVFERTYIFSPQVQKT